MQIFASKSFFSRNNLQKKCFRSIGLYRVFYALNWIYKKANVPAYNDIQSWIGGIFEILFFVDYCMSQFKDFSVLRNAVLRVDEKVRDVSDSIEFKVIDLNFIIDLDYI